MAGSISLSLSQQFNSLGAPLSGGRLYTYAAGTTTPQSAYQDSALTLPWPNPLTLNSAGRIPQLFFADGSIKIRLEDADGIAQLAADGILVVGASSGGGGGSPVDATTLLQTGWVQHIYGTGVVTGFVRCNGRTIGNAVSGATERANADTSALFSFLWGADPNLAVSTGRGASAAADYAANKTIALPDFRGRVIAGLDDMGSSAAGRLSSSYFGATATTLGASGGAESLTLTASQIPTINSSGTITVVPPTSYVIPINTGVSQANANNTGSLNVPNGSVTWSSASSLVGTGQTMTSTNTGGQAHRTVQPTMLATIYMKL